MSTAQTTAPTNANLDAADGLEELAVFLRQHPELPEVSVVAWISDLFNRNTRADLSQFADALGDRAVESTRGDNARIEGAFGPVHLHAEAKISVLNGSPPQPKYEPIIPVRA